MKKTTAVVLLALAVAPTSLFADSAAGYLSFKYASDGDSGLGPGLLYTWNFDYDIRVDARLSYLHFPDPDLDMVPVEATAAYQFETGTTARPYAGLGLGYYFVGANRGKADNDFGFQFFGGVDVELDWSFDFFAEISYLLLESDVDETFAENEKTGPKIDLDSFGINVGLTYRF
jgi:hypothetical protein